MGCSESKTTQQTLKPRPKKDILEKEKAVKAVKRKAKEAVLERKETGKLLERDEDCEPHYLLDDMLRSGDYLTQSKQRQGHEGALMLAKSVHTYQVLLYGPPGSGKTHLLYTLINSHAEEPVETDTPREEVLYVTKGTGQNKRANFRVTDVGGDEAQFPRVERILKEGGVQGLVFVVDSAGSEGDTRKAKAMLESILAYPEMRNVPVLLFGSKADLPNAKSIEVLASDLGFQHIIEPRPSSTASVSIATDEGLRSAAYGLSTLAVQISAIPEHLPSVAVPKKRSLRGLR